MNVQTNDERKFVNVTPTWTEILPIWLRIARAGYSSTDDSQAGNIARFEAEMARMAESADKWNVYAGQVTAQEADYGKA